MPTPKNCTWRVETFEDEEMHERGVLIRLSDPPMNITVELTVRQVGELRRALGVCVMNAIAVNSRCRAFSRIAIAQAQREN